MSKYNMKTHEKEKDQRTKNIALETLKTQYGLKEFFIIYEKFFLLKTEKSFIFRTQNSSKKVPVYQFLR